MIQRGFLTDSTILEFMKKFKNQLKENLTQKFHILVIKIGMDYLSWMSYGYGLSMTPLQILTFYNSIANDGEMVGPKFIYSYKKPGSTNEVVYEKEF